MINVLKASLIIITSLALSGFFYLGPPFKKSAQFNLIPQDTNVTVGITHVTLKDDSEKNELFWDSTFAVVDSLKDHKGYLGHRIRKRLFTDEGWTMTIWRDDESLNAFVRGDMHGRAMSRNLPAVRSARFLRLSIPRSDVPLSWDDVEVMMDEKGRALY